MALSFWLRSYVRAFLLTGSPTQAWRSGRPYLFGTSSTLREAYKAFRALPALLVFGVGLLGFAAMVEIRPVPQTGTACVPLMHPSMRGVYDSTETCILVAPEDVEIRP